MKIYTKTGDDGDTSLGCGGRISKNDLRVDAYGTLDELSSVLGVVTALLLKNQAVIDHVDYYQQWMEWLQEKLFTLSSMLATANLPASTMPQLDLEDVGYLEQQIDQMESQLPPLKNFILPGGNELVSFIHLARTVCRRSERVCTALDREAKLEPVVLPFLNRLSDFLFVFARWTNEQLGEPEKIWLGRKHPEQQQRIMSHEELALRLAGEETPQQLPLFTDDPE